MSPNLVGDEDHEGQKYDQAEYFSHWSYSQYFPNFDYALRGYDINMAYPQAVGHDPGLTYPVFKANYSNRILSADRQFHIPDGFLIAPDVSCRLSFTSDIIENESDLKSYLTLGAGINVGFINWFRFSLNGQYQKIAQDINTGNYVYIMSTAVCKYYSSKLNERRRPPLDDDFLDYAKELLSNGTTASDVKRFIDYYGTHYISEITFGAKFIYESKLSKWSYNQLKRSNVNIKTEASSFGYMEATGNFERGYFETLNFSKVIEEAKTITIGASPPPDGDADTWAYYVRKSPLPISYKLTPIDDIFTASNMKRYPNIDYHTIQRRISSQLENRTAQEVEIKTVVQVAECPDSFTDMETGCYNVSKRKMSFGMAVTYCQSIGSHLAYITSAQEQEAIVRYVNRNSVSCKYTFRM